MGKKIANNIIPFVLAVRNKINFDDIKDIIEINDAAALFAEPSMNAPFSSANDSIYGNHYSGRHKFAYQYQRH